MISFIVRSRAYFYCSIKIQNPNGAFLTYSEQKEPFELFVYGNVCHEHGQHRCQWLYYSYRLDIVSCILQSSGRRNRFGWYPSVCIVSLFVGGAQSPKRTHPSKGAGRHGGSVKNPLNCRICTFHFFSDFPYYIATQRCLAIQHTLTADEPKK